MTQLNIKGYKQSLVVVCSHRNRSIAVAEPSETKNPEFQSACCKCGRINDPLKRGSARESCRWAETGISFYRNKNTPGIPCIFIKPVWPKSLT